MSSFSWDTGSYGGSAYVETAGWGWYNLTNETFPTCRLAANGLRPLLVGSISFIGGGAGGKVAKFNASDGAGERTSGLVANPSTFQFVVRATAAGTTTFLRNTASGTIKATNTADTLTGQLPGTIVYTEVPSAPTISALTQASLTEAQATWTAPSSDGGSAVTGYQVDWSTVSDFSSDVHTTTVGAVLSATLSGITPASTIYVRVAAINAVASAAGTTSVFSTTDDLIMVADVGDVDGWASYGTDPSGITPLVTGGIRRGEVTPLGDGTTGLIREYTRTGSGGPTTAGARGIQRTFTGLTIGETYRLNGTALSMSDTTPSTNTYRWAVTTIGNGSYATITDDATPAAIPEYEFVATAISHVVQIQAGAASWTTAGYFEQVAFYGITLTLVPNPTDFFCQDLELESSLANHYTVACATLGAAWWVGADNVTRFRQADDTPGIIATFSDVTTDGTIPYTDVAVSQSTKNIANILTITNYGVGDDVTTAFTDDDSIAAWGPREARLSLSLYDGPTYLAARADEVFARMSVPHRQITSVTFNAQQDLSIVQQLEIQARVAVTFEGVTDTLRVVGVRHEITADLWLVTLDLSIWGYPEATSSGIGISDLSDHSVTGTEVDATIAAALETSYRYLGQVRYTSNDTFDKADYPTLRAVRFRCQGAGGAGAGVASPTAGHNTKGGGGGGGGYAEKWVLVASLGTSETITVPGLTAGDNDGGATGGTASAGSHCTATGGVGGVTGATSSAFFVVAGGAGGGGTGDLVVRGGPGGSASGSGQLGSGGPGGDAHLGGGGAGQASASGSAGAAGIDATGYGGGGGGAYCNGSTSGAKAGGDGAPGIVIVDLYE